MKQLTAYSLQLTAKNKGFSLVAAIFVMVIFLLIGYTMISLLAGETLSAAKGLAATKAFYMAEAGINYDISRLLRNDYDWVNNIYDKNLNIRKLLPFDFNPAVDPPADHGVKWNSDYNAVNRSMGADAYESNIIDPLNSTDAYGNVYQSCVVDSFGYSAGCGLAKHIKQTVERYFLGAFQYAGVAGGIIDFTSGSGTGVTSGRYQSTVGYQCSIFPPGEIDSDWTLPVSAILPDMTYFLTIAQSQGADHVTSDGHFFPGIYSGTYYVIGSAWIHGGAIIEGTIVATNGIVISPDISINLTSGATQAALVTEGRISSDGSLGGDDITIKGFIYSGSDIDISAPSNLNIDGAVYANTNMQIWADYLNITYNPAVQFAKGFYINNSSDPLHERASGGKINLGKREEVSN